MMFKPRLQGEGVQTLEVDYVVLVLILAAQVRQLQTT